MAKVRVYHRRYPGTNRRDVFIVHEYANGRYHHHRTFATLEAAEKYAETAIELFPRTKVYKHKTSEESLKAIMKSDKYTFPKRIIV